MKTKGNILVIDDTNESLALLTNLLNDEGYTTFTADSGELALISLEKRIPDLILLDVLMPDIDGFEVCRRIKSDNKFRQIPVIFLTASLDQNIRIEGLQIGVVDYILKPFIKEELIARVKIHIELFKLNRAIFENEENLYTTLNSIGDGVISTDTNGLIVNMNPVAEKLCGWKLNEAKGKLLTDVFIIVNADTRNLVANPVEKVLESGKLAGLANNTILISKDGKEYMISDSAAPIKSNNGIIRGVVLVFSDVTDKYIEQKKVIESEKRYSNLLNNLEVGIVVHAPDTSIISNNEKAEKLLGLNSNQMKGKKAAEPIWKFIDENKIPLTLDNYPVNRVINSKKPIKNQILGILKSDDKNIVWVSVNGFPSFNYTGDITEIVISVTDITEMYKAEQELKFSEKKYSDLIENMGEGIGIIDANEKFVFMNPAGERIFGVGKGELVNVNSEIFINGSENFKLLKERTIERSQGKKSTYEQEIVLKDGSIKNLLVNATPMFEDNIFKGTYTIFSDITDRKQILTELKIAKDNAEKSNRLKSVFLANMSHEIRTPMNGILGFTELLKEDNLTHEQQLNYINIIEKSGVRMLNIINDIIDISKVEAGLMKVDLHESNINEQIDYLYTFFKPEVEAKGMHLFHNKTLADNKAIIITDREKVFAILTNLIKNAIKYSIKGSIEIGYNLKKDSKTAELEFYIKDTGIGIPSELQQNIFERFIQIDNTLSNTNNGAGLGLTITKSYVELLGGKIWLESKENEGSTFYFSLPYNIEKKKLNEIENQNAVLKNDNEIKKLKTLIVDDDEVSRLLISSIVKKISYELIQVENGLEAVNACRNNPDIDLVLMDILMPVMNGYEATMQIREFNKKVVIIAQTAYSFEGEREKALNTGCTDYLAKPIRRNLLIEIINKHFDIFDQKK